MFFLLFCDDHDHNDQGYGNQNTCADEDDRQQLVPKVVTIVQEGEVVGWGINEKPGIEDQSIPGFPRKERN